MRFTPLFFAATIASTDCTTTSPEPSESSAGAEYARACFDTLQRLLASHERQRESLFIEFGHDMPVAAVDLLYCAESGCDVCTSECPAAHRAHGSVDRCATGQADPAPDSHIGDGRSHEMAGALRNAMRASAKIASSVPEGSRSNAPSAGASSLHPPACEGYCGVVHTRTSAESRLSAWLEWSSRVFPKGQACLFFSITLAIAVSRLSGSMGLSSTMFRTLDTNSLACGVTAPPVRKTKRFTNDG